MNMILAYNKPSVFSFGKILVGTFWILPLAYFIRFIPLVVRSTNAVLEQMDDSIEEAAQNLGAKWFYTFRRVVLPIIMPGVLSGTLLAFVQAIGEFPDRKSTRLNSSHVAISYAVFCLKKKTIKE